MLRIGRRLAARQMCTVPQGLTRFIEESIQLEDKSGRVQVEKRFGQEMNRFFQLEEERASRL